jgi:hypothetical protein
MATDTGEEEITSSRPPKFSGKQEYYQIYNTRNKAFSRMKGCSVGYSPMSQMENPVGNAV